MFKFQSLTLEKIDLLFSDFYIVLNTTFKNCLRVRKAPGCKNQGFVRQTPFFMPTKVQKIMDMSKIVTSAIYNVKNYKQFIILDIWVLNSYICSHDR